MITKHERNDTELKRAITVGMDGGIGRFSVSCKDDSNVEVYYNQNYSLTSDINDKATYGAEVILAALRAYPLNKLDVEFNHETCSFVLYRYSTPIVTVAHLEGKNLTILPKDIRLMERSVSDLTDLFIANVKDGIRAHDLTVMLEELVRAAINGKNYKEAEELYLPLIDSTILTESNKHSIAIATTEALYDSKLNTKGLASSNKTVSALIDVANGEFRDTPANIKYFQEFYQSVTSANFKSLLDELKLLNHR